MRRKNRLSLGQVLARWSFFGSGFGLWNFFGYNNLSSLSSATIIPEKPPAPLTLGAGQLQANTFLSKR